MQLKYPSKQTSTVLNEETRRYLFEKGHKIPSAAAADIRHNFFQKVDLYYCLQQHREARRILSIDGLHNVKFEKCERIDEVSPFQYLYITCVFPYCLFSLGETVVS
jgi:hypothetical protein